MGWLPVPMSEINPQEEEASADIALMLAVKCGDEKAFEKIVERHQSRIVGTIAKMLGGVTDAEDIAQQVFMRVWQSAPRYTPSAKFTTWLLTITRNLVFNEMRRRQRARLVSMDAEDADRPPTAYADTSARSATEEILEAELQNAISAAIASLPETQRLAVILRRFENMPYEEIASVLGTTIPAVKSLLFRARNDLREKLKLHLGE